MASEFDCTKFKRIEISDQDVLENLLLSLEPKTCEMNFVNLFTWSGSYDTVFQISGGLPYLLMTRNDGLLFPAGTKCERFPSAETLHSASEELKICGASGIFYHVPEDYLKLVPDCLRYFDAVPAAAEYDEYIYETEKLALLPGSKLGKKRNLISQFRRLYPDASVVPLTPERLPDCRRLECSWIQQKESGADPGKSGESVSDEEAALSKTYDHFGRLHAEGLCLYAEGRLAAFSIFSRLSSEMWDEHYEKADSACKGAAQVINQETAAALRGRGRFINREQDLGDEGLRHAKMSYAPAYLLKNFNLVPKAL